MADKRCAAENSVVLVVDAPGRVSLNVNAGLLFMHCLVKLRCRLCNLLAWACFCVSQVYHRGIGGDERHLGDMDLRCLAEYTSRNS